MLRTTIPLLFLLAWARLTAPVSAGFPRPEPPLPQRIAVADCVVVGKVKRVLEEPAQAFALPKIAGAPKVAHQMAVVAVESVLVGANDLREVRVGFVAPPASSRRRPEFQWSVDQEGCFFLRKHPDESFWVIQTAFDVVDKAKTKDYDRDLALLKRCAELLKDADRGLCSAEGDERLLAAALLLFRYRTPQYVYRGEPKTEPIEPGQSRLILSVLSEGEWTEKDVRTPLGRFPLFLRIGVTARDGWRPSESDKESAEAAWRWLRAHAASYRIRRYVPPDK